MSAEAEGQRAEAEECRRRAAAHRGDFQEMAVRSVSEMTFWNAMALRRLERREEADALLEAAMEYAHELERQVPKIDYFATSLPAMLLFEDDLARRNRIEARYLEGQALFGLGKKREAERLLREVLEMEKSHAGAADLLRDAESLRRVCGLE